jgi:hypothetical protein
MNDELRGAERARFYRKKRDMFVEANMNKDNSKEEYEFYTILKKSMEEDMERWNKKRYEQRRRSATRSKSNL